MSVTVLTTKVSLPDANTVQIDTDRISLRLFFVDGRHIFVYLRDLVRKEYFEFMASQDSRSKLEQFITNGISEKDYEFLTCISSLKTWTTQAKYFEKLGEGNLTLKQCLRAVKLSTASKFTSRDIRVAREYLLKVFTVVCQVEGGDRILYCKKDEYEFVLHARLSFSDDHYPCCYAVITELGAKHLEADRYCDYAIYRYIRDGRRDLLKKRLERAADHKFTEMISVLNESDIIHDRERYDYLKTLLSLSSI